MTIDIHQFGGYEGSFAGDCGLIVVGKQWWMIDMGTTAGGAVKTQFMRAYAVIEGGAFSGGTLLLTHWHADHTGGGSHGKYLNFLGKKRPDFWSLKIDELREDTLPTLAFDNGEELVGATIADRTISLRAIVPDFARISEKMGELKGAVTENFCSLGALLQVCPRMRKNVEFGFLTMGDMEPFNEGRVLKAIGDDPIHLIKYPHHGSTHNYFDNVFTKVLAGKKTHVIISGYTRTELTGIDWLFGAGAASVTLLIGDSATAHGMLELMGIKDRLSKYRLRIWDNATVTVDVVKTQATMRGRPWINNSRTASASLGAEESVVILGEGAAAGEEKKEEKEDKRKGSKRRREPPKKRGGGEGEDEVKSSSKSLKQVLVGSVQELAEACGVTTGFAVGHADGENKNCLIISIYAAANIELSDERQEEIRNALEDEGLCDEDEDVDLDRAGKRILRFLAEDAGRANWAVNVLEANPVGAGFMNQEQLHIGRDPRTTIFLFHASAHFSPAHRK